MLSLSERMGSNVMSKTKELRVELRRNTDSNKSLEEALEANTETINSFLAIADKFISSVEKIEERGNNLEAAVEKMREYSANFDNLLPKHEKIISKVKEHGENTYKNIDKYRKNTKLKPPRQAF